MNRGKADFLRMRLDGLVKSPFRTFHSAGEICHIGDDMGRVQSLLFCTQAGIVDDFISDSSKNLTGFVIGGD